MTNINNIKKNKNKNKYNWTFTNKWSNQKIQSDHETISKMLYELSTEQLSRTVTHNTVHIQQQHTGIHKNLIISSKIQQRHANKQQNDQAERKQQASNSARQENVTNSWTAEKKSTICTQKNEDLLQFMTWEHIYV